MNIHGLPSARRVVHDHQACITRRQFLKRAAGASAVALGSSLLPSLASIASAHGLPDPIPGGIQPFGPGTEIFHVLLPAHPAFGNPDPATNDPSLITNFNGHIALGYATGLGTRTEKATGTVQTGMPWEADLRIMQGEYVDHDGHNAHGSFVLF